MINPNTTFERLIESRFSEHQDGAIASILGMASQTRYVASGPAIYVEFPTVALAMALVSVRDRLTMPDAFLGLSVVAKAQGFSEVIQVGESTQGQALSVAEAIKLCDRSPYASGICLFSDSGLGVRYVNSKMESFTGMPASTHYQENTQRLFIQSPEAVAALQDMEQRLVQFGAVNDFELPSHRSNGEYGVYTVDARLVDWGGLRARLTCYKQFRPAQISR